VQLPAATSQGFYEEMMKQVVLQIITGVECCMELRQRSNLANIRISTFLFFPFSSLNPGELAAGGQSGGTGLMRDWLCSGLQRLTKEKWQKAKSAPLYWPKGSFEQVLLKKPLQAALVDQLCMWHGLMGLFITAP
jgi:hypothetical protein